jgi:hypothetical protein
MGTAIVMKGSTTGGTESALASIDVPMNGNIVGVDWSAYVTFDTNADFVEFQLSFGSAVSQVNDSRQVISMATAGTVTLVTSGIYHGKVDKYVAIPNISVGMGERLYLHSVAAAGVVSVAYCVIYFDFDLDKMAVRRR